MCYLLVRCFLLFRMTMPGVCCVVLTLFASLLRAEDVYPQGASTEPFLRSRASSTRNIDWFGLKVREKDPPQPSLKGWESSSFKGESERVFPVCGSSKVSFVAEVFTRMVFVADMSSMLPK